MILQLKIVDATGTSPDILVLTSLIYSQSTATFQALHYIQDFDKDPRVLAQFQCLESLPAVHLLHQQSHRATVGLRTTLPLFLHPAVGLTSAVFGNKGVGVEMRHV
jgi:hypothetical protein